MVAMFRVLDIFYKVLLYLALPYTVLSIVGFDVINALQIYTLIFIFDALAGGSGWFIHREDEYEPRVGVFAIYFFTACWVLLALLVIPDIYMTYLPIIALLGFLSFLSKANRRFDVKGFISSTLLMLTVLLLISIPLVMAFLPFILLAVLLYYVRDRFTRLKLIFACIFSSILLILSFQDVLRLVSLASFTVMSLQIVEVPNILMQNILYAGFEEFIGRAFIPYVSAGLSTYVFTTLHLPKILTIGFTELSKVFADAGLSIYALMYSLVSSFSWICVGAILLVHAWRRAGLFGAILTHAIVNTVIMLIGMGQPFIALAIVLTLTVASWIVR